jgi:amidase
MANVELHYKTITEVADLLQKREVSPVEVTEAILNRIDTLDSRYKSYATVMTDHAMQAAERAEEEIRKGDYKGPLHGIPIAVKDLCFTNGVRTMGGAKVTENFVPTFDSTVVVRLAEAGSVLLGKLNLTEGAMGGYNPSFDVPLNPWNIERWAGASSSGSGVSTALGLCYGSLGSDTGGSIRYPAASCGTVGLKPTWGRVSRYGVLALAESLDHVGPLTRSSADAAIMVMAMAGLDPNDPTTLPASVPDMLADIKKGVKGIRIGLDETYISDGVDPELSRAVLDGVRILENLGADIVEVKMPNVEQYTAFWRTLCTVEALDAHREFYPSRRGEYGPYFQEWLDIGATVSGLDYVEANNKRNECNGLIRLAMQDIDVLACPSTIGPAYPITMEQMYGPIDKNRDPSSQRFTVPYDYNGYPTLSVPCGLSSDGMPLSLQFVGHPLSETLLCRVGHTYEQATEWSAMHPPV